jgi:hypothetical protein
MRDFVRLSHDLPKNFRWLQKPYLQAKLSALVVRAFQLQASHEALISHFQP